MLVPFVNLRAQYKSLEREISAAVGEVLASGSYILSDHVEFFERDLAAYCQTSHAVGVASGSDALALALQALGVGQGDEVITSPFTYVATASAIARIGALPVFADIEPDTFTISVASADRSLSSRTRAIIPVHIFGLSADMIRIVDWADRHSVAVVEDAAQALGAQCNGRKVGSIGAAGAVSFFPTKALGGAGDGGAVLTNSEGIRSTVDMLRRHGSPRKHHYTRLGINSRLDSLQAAILAVKLSRLDHWISIRREIAARYSELLSDTSLQLPRDAGDRPHTYSQYSVRIANERGELQRFLARNGIASEIYYPICLHRQPLFRHLGYAVGSFPVAERVSKEVLSLPCYPELTPAQQTWVATCIKEWLKSG